MDASFDFSKSIGEITMTPSGDVARRLLQGPLYAKYADWGLFKRHRLTEPQVPCIFNHFKPLAVAALFGWSGIDTSICP